MTMKGQPLTFDATPEELVLFMSEGEEQLELLAQDIIRMEQEGDGNTELLQEIFRAAHTLKGSSGAIGHQRMARLTHAAESVLDQVRHHQLPVSTILVDLLLKSLDALRQLLDEVTAGMESAVAIEDLSAALIALANGQQPTPDLAVSASAAIAAPVPPSAPVAAPTPVGLVPPRSQFVSPADFMRELEVWRIECAIDPQFPLPSARALQIVLASETLGAVAQSSPARAAIEAGEVKMGTPVIVWLALSEGITNERIRERLERIPDVQVTAIVPPEPAEGTETATGNQLAQVQSGATEETAQILTLRAQIAADCVLPAPRALQVVLACSQLGEVLTSDPSDAVIEDGKVLAGSVVTVTFRASDPTAANEDRLRAICAKISEVTVLDVALNTPDAELADDMTEEELSRTAPGNAHADTASPPRAVDAVPAPLAAPAVLPAPKAPESAPRTAVAESNVNPAVTHPENEQTRSATPVQAPRMVRIDVERLDALMNLIGELVIGRTRLSRIGANLIGHTDDLQLMEDLTETSRHIARISDDLQDQVMRSRMLPIESVFSKFPRLVRDLAQRVNKKVEFIVEGKDTELDRSVAEQIGDPIIHLLRNAIDHGLETQEERHAAGKSEVGQVRLSARHEENQIVIDVDDDGRGIIPDRIKAKAVTKGLLTTDAASRISDREAVELIFAPGFSTAEQVSDISGRGVGMDIVRTNVERLNGSIAVETEPGQGSRFTIRLPLTLAIIRALLVSVAGQTYAIPLTSVVEALRIQQEDLRSVNHHLAIELRGQVLPLMRLAEVFKQSYKSAATTAMTRQFVVAIRWGDRRCGLIVESLIGEQEIVIKPLGKLFRNVRGISGGAVLGDGQVAPILDVAALIKYVIANERTRGEHDPILETAAKGARV